MAPALLPPGPLLHDPLMPAGTQQTWSPKRVYDAPKRASFAFDLMEEALRAFAAGEFVVVMDDKNRENEGDLIIAASQCSTEKMAWMIKHTREVIDLLNEQGVILTIATVVTSVSHSRANALKS
ncbi:hypothetical protein AX15_002126 [Amanita polypyramis BW_CC]|nr:hypothetical protein AX15_002126 [Amanita polypyramis BW_CC]